MNFVKASLLGATLALMSNGTDLSLIQESETVETRGQRFKENRKDFRSKHAAQDSFNKMVTQVSYNGLNYVRQNWYGREDLLEIDDVEGATEMIMS